MVRILGKLNRIDSFTDFDSYCLWKPALLDFLPKIRIYVYSAGKCKKIFYEKNFEQKKILRVPIETEKRTNEFEANKIEKKIRNFQFLSTS